MVVGAGFDIVPGSLVVDGDEVRLSAVRARTLADTVGAGMRILVCGVNPAIYSADVGVGYGRPGNRFWPAALEAGLVTRDRDPLDALVSHGMGMTDFVKRATRTAAEVTTAEYRHGFGRVERLVRWLEPGAVCFVGLSGWRAAVDPRAASRLAARRSGGPSGLRDAVDQRPQRPHPAGRAGRPPAGGRRRAALSAAAAHPDPLVLSAGRVPTAVKCSTSGSPSR